MEEEHVNEKNVDFDYDEDIACLKNNSLPFKEAEIKWKRTFNARKNNFTCTQYLKEFPIIKETLGYLLFEEDFQELYQEKENLLLLNWPMLHTHIITNTQKRRQIFAEIYCR